MRVLDLFSGIGGFSLGLERAGMTTVAFCEIDPFCRAVLAKHWPGIHIFEDVRSLSAQHITAAGLAVDVICGGFPCQDISVAGRGAGIDGERSGLWSEFSRLIGELRPRYVIVENVAALLVRGLSRVLGDLATLGYNAEWHCIPAAAIGAPHRRDRIWIVAYPIGARLEGGAREPRYNAGECAAIERSGAVRDARRVTATRHRPVVRAAEQSDWWFIEPDVGRVAHGVPARVDRLRALGNAVVPQIPELIGRAIMAGYAP